MILKDLYWRKYMSNKLKEIIKNALTKLDIDISLENIMIETPKDTKNGDYSSNIAMKLAKTLKIVQ